MKIKAECLYSIFLIILLLVGCNTSNAVQTAELRAAYEKFQQESMNARLNLDISQVSQVTTGEVLETIIADVDQQRDFTKVLIAREAEIGRKFHVIEYDDSHAVINTNVLYRNFEQDIETGQRNYYTERWYKVRVEMVREDKQWKVAHIESEDYWN